MLNIKNQVVDCELRTGFQVPDMFEVQMDVFERTGLSGFALHGAEGLFNDEAGRLLQKDVVVTFPGEADVVVREQLAQAGQV